MDALQKNRRAMLKTLIQIKGMIFEDPEQPIKNCEEILNNILIAVDEDDVGLPVNLDAIDS